MITKPHALHLDLRLSYVLRASDSFLSKQCYDLHSKPPKVTNIRWKVKKIIIKMDEKHSLKLDRLLSGEYPHGYILAICAWKYHGRSFQLISLLSCIQILRLYRACAWSGDPGFGGLQWRISWLLLLFQDMGWSRLQRSIPCFSRHSNHWLEKLVEQFQLLWILYYDWYLPRSNREEKNNSGFLWHWIERRALGS